MNYGKATLVTFSTYPLTSLVHHQAIKQNNRNSIDTLISNDQGEVL